ncbi:MAG: MBOAT family protein [Granulosicoccus sp.]
MTCSLFFYGFWNPAYLLLLLASISVNYAIGYGLFKNTSKPLLLVGIAFNLALIAYFKYANFFVSLVADVANASYTLQEIVLPLGISFFTFQQITWLVDTYKGNCKRYGFIDYAQFVTFFPQLIAGPIVHHHEMMPQFNKENILASVSNNFAFGLTIFSIGLFKKVILADTMALSATPVFAAAEQGIALTLYEAWIGALSFSLQLYFDFSGYSDMAIGLARMFGIRLPLNFNSPYKAISIIDFWRRWHMTLSRFLRDYLYIPLGGNQKGKTRRYVNIAITMLLGGLWHGAGWTFIIWGAMHAAFIMINQAWRSFKPIHSSGAPRNLLNRSISQLLTLLCVVVAWVVFRAESGDAAWSMLRSMSGINGIALPAQLQSVLGSLPGLSSLSIVGFGRLFHNELVQPLSACLWIFGTGLIALGFPNTQQLINEKWKPNGLWALLISILMLYSLLHLTQISEFLYFQF